MHDILDVKYLLRYHRWPVVVTWLLVLLENTLLALIPLFIGRAIDALLANEAGALWEIAGIMGALILVASARRAYDTRCYGTMRVRFGAEVISRIGVRPVSQVNARLDMSREMVDFLEAHVPDLLTAVVQLIVSIAILWAFDQRLGISAISVIAILVIVYGFFHRRFYRLNRDLNTQKEQQVNVLEQRKPASLLEHLKRLRHHEVRLSDTEVILYAAIFSGMFTFVLINLWLTSTLPVVTAGLIFAVVSYSWELVESCIVLPIALQQWSRLTEIRERL
jgi:ABC-type multidrug transport system fused ATPase/permease subunit